MGISSEQVRFFLDRTRQQTPDADEALLLSNIRGPWLSSYSEQRPHRAQFLELWMGSGDIKACAAFVSVSVQTAREWIREWVGAVAACIRRQAQLRDEDILKSICLLTHRRIDRGGSGGADSSERLRGTTCIGCQLRAG